MKISERPNKYRPHTLAQLSGNWRKFQHLICEHFTMFQIIFPLCKFSCLRGFFRFFTNFSAEVQLHSLFPVSYRYESSWPTWKNKVHILQSIHYVGIFIGRRGSVIVMKQTKLPLILFFSKAFLVHFNLPILFWSVQLIKTTVTLLRQSLPHWAYGDDCHY